MGNIVKKPGFAKILVLASVFMKCYYSEREMTVLELLYFDPRLKSRYGKHPHVLSNLLGRYYKQGLLYRKRSLSRGRPFYYGMSEKGFKRLLWFVCTPKFKSYFYEDRDLLDQLQYHLDHFVEKRKLAMEERRRRHFLEY